MKHQIKISKSDILNFLSKEKEQLETKFRVSKIGLFGSYARGEETAESDIDIILEFFPKTENLTDLKFALKALIKKEFGKDVDICREKYLKPYYRTQILKSAIYV
jgi:predicted nucleotidyltransferase